MFYSIDEARLQAQKRLPRIVFDFVDGASGNETLPDFNSNELSKIRLMPRVLKNIENRNLSKNFMSLNYNLPFGFAPMGLCNLTWPNADTMMAYESKVKNIPHCVSMASSTTLEEIFEKTEGRSWFQIYVGQDESFVLEMINRAKDIGYKVLILTVDVPVLSRRAKDQRNGFDVPYRFGFKQFIDFATHPTWSILSLINGPPKPMNYFTSKSKKGFVRKESRGSSDYNFLRKVREIWKDKLVVKGVMSSDDAKKIKDTGADAIYISNHGGRQLESAPASINVLSDIRKSVGKSFPLIFDSGVRSGDDIIKSIAMGADFVMVGRPLMYGIGANGHKGLKKILEIIESELSTTLGLVGLKNVNDVSSDIIYKNKG